MSEPYFICLSLFHCMLDRSVWTLQIMAWCWIFASCCFIFFSFWWLYTMQNIWYRFIYSRDNWIQPFCSHFQYWLGCYSSVTHVTYSVFMIRTLNYLSIVIWCIWQRNFVEFCEFFKLVTFLGLVKVYGQLYDIEFDEQSRASQLSQCIYYGEALKTSLL